jgi:hypothetical protein
VAVQLDPVYVFILTNPQYLPHGDALCRLYIAGWQAGAQRDTRVPMNPRVQQSFSVRTGSTIADIQRADRMKPPRGSEREAMIGAHKVARLDLNPLAPMKEPGLVGLIAELIPICTRNVASANDVHGAGFE